MTVDKWSSNSDNESLFIQKKIPKFKINSIISSLALVGYLVGFSFAYLTINSPNRWLFHN